MYHIIKCINHNLFSSLSFSLHCFIAPCIPEIFLGFHGFHKQGGVMFLLSLVQRCCFKLD